MKRGLLSIALMMVLMMTTMGAYYVRAVAEEPALLFEPVSRIAAADAAGPTPLFDVEAYLPTEKPGTTPIPTIQPETPATADTDPLEEGKPLTGIVNIALFGLDAKKNGRTTSGTMVHTDTNMIMAINFDTKEVSLISIARDAFTDVPGHAGYYKFNGIFNVGGGMEDPKAGLELSCRAAEMWLGGVSVPYYYGVDFQALIDLVDALGGIDYDSEIELSTLDGRTIPKGQHHLDGQGVMAYVRKRRSTAGGLDYQRTERQRKMMIALFTKIKEEGQLSMISKIAGTTKGREYTNLSAVQIAALADFARDVEPGNVHPFSFHGGMYERFDWRYCFIFQQDRLDILKEVYGIDAAPLGVNSPSYEQFLHSHGLLALQHIGYARRLFEAIHSSVSAEDMSEEQKRLYAACWKDCSDLQAAFDLASRWAKIHYDEKEKLSIEDSQERYRYNTAMGKLEERLRSSGNALNKAFGSPVKLEWYKDISQWYEKDSVINEVYVDFR